MLSELPRRRMTPSIAAGRAGKAPLFEHMDVRVGAGARPARSAGQSSQPDWLDRHAGAMALATFPERKVARSPWRRAEKDMDVEVPDAEAHLRTSHWMPACASMTSYAARLSATTAFNPPNANAFDSAARTLRSRAVFGT